MTQRPFTWPIRPASQPAKRYCSHMCSSVSSPGGLKGAAAEVAAKLAGAIDECAAAAHSSGGAEGPDLTTRLAAMWAMLTDADPELAACTARYSRS